MAQLKRYGSNAERQRAYRLRKRNAMRNAGSNVTPVNVTLLEALRAVGIGPYVRGPVSRLLEGRGD